MNIFKLSPYILTKIKTVVADYITAVHETDVPDWVIDFFAYEPDKEYIKSCTYEKDSADRKPDGTIAVYGKRIDFDNVNSADNPRSSCSLYVDIYGYGDVIKSTTDDVVSYTHDTQEAERRAQILTTLVYYAIMDKQEVAGSDDVTVNFGSSLTIEDWKPKSIVKGTPLGNVDTTRSISGYRAEFEFDFSEETPSESLGEAYAGFETLTITSTNPD